MGMSWTWENQKFRKLKIRIFKNSDATHGKH
jgi:hypothetical protein